MRLTLTAVRTAVALSLFAAAAFSTGCASHKSAQVGQRLDRQGDEIMVGGQLFHTGAPVVLWTDPGGYDAYRTERRFAPWDQSSFEDTLAEYKATKPDWKRNWVHQPNRYDIRFEPSTQPTTRSDHRTSSRLTQEQFEMVRGGGWPMDLLRDKIDQFVLHYDVAGTSHSCFRTLQDMRGLSVTFMCDVDGTIYQTLDVKERAWQATKANSRSVGIEIANIGAYPPSDDKVLKEWYRKDASGRTQMVLPAYARHEWIKTPNFVARPARPQPVVGNIQGEPREMYDLTPQQYDSLIKLTAALCTVLPKIKCDYPRDENGNLITHTLSSEQYDNYQGVLGHYHVQDNKQDPGPALQWDKLINGARKRMGLKPLPPGDVINNPAKPALAQAK